MFQQEGIAARVDCLFDQLRQLELSKRGSREVTYTDHVTREVLEPMLPVVYPE
jgi:hypothetical protein